MPADTGAWRIIIFSSLIAWPGLCGCAEPVGLLFADATTCASYRPLALGGPADAP